MTVSIEEIKPGVKVEYHPVGTAMQTSIGTVKEVFKHDTTTGSSPHHVHADPEHPRILIVNDHTHKETPYKLENIVRVVQEGSQQ